MQCDGLIVDDRSRSDTWPDIQIPHVTVAHEAVAGKISDEQLFYLQSRGPLRGGGGLLGRVARGG